jgi:hypothetical protein
MLNDLFKLHEQHQQHVTSGDTQAAAEVLASSAVLCERLLLFLDGAQHLRASRAEREKIVSKLKVGSTCGCVGEQRCAGVGCVLGLARVGATLFQLQP